jgi:hypothetical protein
LVEARRYSYLPDTPRSNETARCPNLLCLSRQTREGQRNHLSHQGHLFFCSIDQDSIWHQHPLPTWPSTSLICDDCFAKLVVEKCVACDVRLVGDRRYVSDNGEQSVYCVPCHNIVTNVYKVHSIATGVILIPETPFSTCGRPIGKKRCFQYGLPRPMETPFFIFLFFFPIKHTQTQTTTRNNGTWIQSVVFFGG